jgi:hypothetical protein
MISIIAEGVSLEIMDVLEQQGLKVRRSLDIDIPDFPEDITLVDDSELMDMASKYMENYNFLLTQVACAELAITEQEEQLDFKTAEMLITLSESGSKMTATLIKAHITTDTLIKSMSDRMLKAKAYHKLLKAMLDNAERSYQLTSRELTRRTAVFKTRSF